MALPIFAMYLDVKLFLATDWTHFQYMVASCLLCRWSRTGRCFVRPSLRHPLAATDYILSQTCAYRWIKVAAIFRVRMHVT